MRRGFVGCQNQPPIFKEAVSEQFAKSQGQIPRVQLPRVSYSSQTLGVEA